MENVLDSSRSLRVRVNVNHLWAH